MVSTEGNHIFSMQEKSAVDQGNSSLNKPGHTSLRHVCQATHTHTHTHTQASTSPGTHLCDMCARPHTHTHTHARTHTHTLMPNWGIIYSKAHQSVECHACEQRQGFAIPPSHSCPTRFGRARPPSLSWPNWHFGPPSKS